MSITSPSVDQSSALQQSTTQATTGSGAVDGHHHHHGGGGGSEFATLLADLTEANETDPTSGADSSVLTASAASTDPTGSGSSTTDPLLSALGAGATNPNGTDPFELGMTLSELEQNSTTL